MLFRLIDRLSDRGAGRRRPGGLRARIALLMAISAAGCVVAFLWVQSELNQQIDLMLWDRVDETQRVLHAVLDLRSDSGFVHAEDYGRWDDLAAFTRKPDPEWARVNLTESIQTFGVEVAWVLDDGLRLVYTANPKRDPALTPLPASREALRAALNPHGLTHFFARAGRDILEVWCSPIHPSDDFAFKAVPSGYYLIGRVWTDARVAAIAKAAGGAAWLLPAQARRASGSTLTGGIEIFFPLPAIDGRPLASLFFQTAYPVAPKVHNAFRLSFLVLVGGVLVTAMGVSIALARWVARPLIAITGALRSEDPALLGGAARRRDELGRLARLVADFFVQRDKLIEARKAAEVAVLAKSEFLANTSHELRTPMHGILSYASFGLRDAATADRAELLDDFRNIQECGQSLLALLNDLLDLAKFEAGRMILAFQEVWLDEAVGGAESEFATLLRERQLALSVDIEDDLPAVWADRTKVLQVLRNLISNALKFSPPGAEVTIQVLRVGPCARVTVRDSGPGIPPDELELIFEKFTQGSRNASRAGGTGLGLTICREIAEAHGGRIWAENDPAGGARLVLELPFAGPAAAGESPADTTPGAAGELARVAPVAATTDVPEDSPLLTV